MAHLILQLGVMPLIPFPCYRHNVRRLRLHALWEAAMAARQQAGEPPLIEAALLPTRLPRVRQRTGGARALGGKP